jgi:hypothetical protein
MGGFLWGLAAEQRVPPLAVPERIIAAGRPAEQQAAAAGKASAPPRILLIPSEIQALYWLLCTHPQ